MSESRKRLLIDLGIGLLAVVVCAVWFDLFSAPTLADALRILSDCFFLAAVLMLATGGLTFTSNGGVWDGIGFTFKTAFSRIKGQYEQERFTFAQYREERERKHNKSPRSALISGAVYLVLALIVLAAYNAVI